MKCVIYLHQTNHNSSQQLCRKTLLQNQFKSHWLVFISLKQFLIPKLGHETKLKSMVVILNLLTLKLS